MQNARQYADTDKAIRVAVADISRRARARHPLLAHQNAVGMTIFVLSILGILANATLYAKGSLSGAFVVVTSALWMSLLHELEHDLIHTLYFPDSSLVRNVMMFGVWLFRPSTIHPWLRRKMHLHHHRVSGHESDIEERAITLGEPTGVKRLLMMSDGMLAIVLRLRSFVDISKSFAREVAPNDRAEALRIRRSVRLGYMPLGHIHFVLWHSFIALHVWAFVADAFLLASPRLVVGDSAFQAIDFLVVVWLAPNVLRSFCLNFVSSNIHYYGDIDPMNVVQQTQVWTSPWTWPLQLFCFNFGSTHAIHHFIVRDPFYVRQLIAREAHEVLRAHGVRFNDFGTFGRDNRWHSRPSEADVRTHEFAAG